METNPIDTLLKKYRENRCSPEELAELEHWYSQFEEEAEAIEQIPGEKLDLLYRQIEYQLTRRGRHTVLYSVVRYGLAVAAVLLLLVWGGSYFVSFNSDSLQEDMIAPGYFQAELILSDGSHLILDSTTVVTERNGMLIKKQEQAVLDYSQLESSKAQGMNTIKVPVGGEYRMILADGSRVWLNSGSTLTYPMTFREDSREVVLTGEGYFEVTKSVVPFVVKTSRLDVRVLGTSFDVSAYEEDETVTATLVTGCVVVSGKDIQEPHQLQPGHILTYVKRKGNVSVQECNTELYTSWVKGEFKFRDMRLEEIMVKLNRWYNCSVSYEDPALKDLRFSGAAEKDRPVNYLLEMIEMITDVRFIIDGSQIKVVHK